MLKQCSLLLLGLAATAVHGSTDYGPAIWRPTCNANYYTTGSGHKFHVIHDMEGYYASTISLFTGCGYTAASVHYAINGKQDAASDYAAGEITQMVRDSNYAWHARCWNQHCTGTEHEGFASNPAWYTDAQYQASAGLTANLGNRFGWAKDRNHIIAHGQKSVAGWPAYASANLGIDPNCNTHTDPGPYWDWNRYMNMVNPPVTYPYRTGNPLFWVGNTMRFFAVGTNGQCYLNWQNTDFGPWAGWASIGGSSLSKVKGLQKPNGQLVVYAIGAGGALYVNWQPVPGGAWNGWVSLGGNIIDFDVLIHPQDGLTRVFAVGVDSKVYVDWQTVDGGAWSGWALLDPATGFNKIRSIVKANYTCLFATGNGLPLELKWQTAVGGAWSSGWTSLGGPVLDFDVFTRANQLPIIFAIGSDTGAWTQWQNSDLSWSGWWSLGGTNLATVKGFERQTDHINAIFARQTNGEVIVNNQSSSGGAWLGWSSLGTGLNGLTATRSPLDTFAVYGPDATSAMLGRGQTSYDGGWSSWVNLGGAFPANGGW